MVFVYDYALLFYTQMYDKSFIQKVACKVKIIIIKITTETLNQQN